jgi:multiple sugar transport system substrate-binding protein
MSRIGGNIAGPGVGVLERVAAFRSVAVRAVLLACWLLPGAGCDDAPAERQPDGRLPVRVFVLLISTSQVAFYHWAEQVYEAAHPDVDILIEQFPGSSLKDFEIKLRLRFAGGKAPDLFHVNTNVAAELARLGLLDPAPPEIVAMIDTNSVNEMARTASRFEGTYYGIVSDVVWTALYYNRDHFRAAGLDPDRPPRTWDELLDYADRLTVRRPDGVPIRAGLSLRKTGFKGGTAEKWLTFLFSAGGEAFDEDGVRTLINSEAGRAALDFYAEILFRRRIDDVSLEGDQQGFGQGRVSMFFREPHVIGWLEKNYPDLDFGVAAIPRRDTSLSSGGAYLFAVGRESVHKEAAWAFARFLMQDSVYVRYAAGGSVTPATRSVASRPEYTGDPRWRVFLEQPARNPGGFPRVGRALDILGAYVEQFAYGRLGAEETLRLAERDMNAVLAPNRRRRKSEGAP